MRSIGELTPLVGATEPSAPLLERRRVLEPYVDAVVAAAAESVGLERLGVRLDPWPRDVLQRYPEGDADGVCWPGLIAEGLAFRAACLARLGPAASEVWTEEWLPGGGLTVDVTPEAAVGLALMQELQWSIDLAIADSDVELARNLTDFRNDLGHTVGLLRRAAGSEVFDRARIRARALVQAVPEASELEEPEGEPEEERPWRRIPVIFKRAPRLGRILWRREYHPRRTRELWVAAFLLSLAWWHLAFGPGRARSGDPPLVDGSRFSHIEVFREASAEPPSLYVRLDARGWARMSPQARFDTLRDIAKIAEKAGYYGVHARIDGVPAGRWLRGRGVQIFATGAERGNPGNRT